MGQSRVILPKGFSVDRARQAQAITNVLNATALAMKVDFEVTVQTWNDPAGFQIASPTPYSRTVGTDDSVYSMLNEGTKAHEIRPKAGGILVFNTPFRAKTVPNRISSGPGSKGGNQVISRHGVRHPGTTARAWDTAIAQKWQKLIGAIMQRAIDASV